MGKHKLNIGLVVDDQKVSNWIFSLTKNILSSSDFNICLVVLNPPTLDSSTNLINRFNKYFINQFLKLDKNRYKLNPDAFEFKSLNSIVGCPIIELHDLLNNNYEQTQFESLKNLPKKIDVFLNFNSIPLDIRLLKYSKNGVWSFVIGNYSVKNKIPIGLKEFLDKRNDIRISLIMTRGNLREDHILFTGYISIDKYSYHRYLNNCYWSFVSFIPRKLNELHLQGSAKFLKKVNKENSLPYFVYNKTYDWPNFFTLSKELLNNLLKRIKNKIINKFIFEQWILLYSINFNNSISSKLSQFKRITPPKDRFWADPFVIKRNAKYYIFIEELIYSKGIGTIACIEMDEEGNYSEPQQILEKSYHLSYPFIIQDNDKFYMIPETKNNKSIELYECVDFPYKWKFYKNLFENIEAVDSTILKYEEKYWLFTNIKENPMAPTSDNELFLFYSDNLLNGKWISHPKNPIVSDVKKSRPAGKIFIQNDRLYRPAQNCAKHYGYGITINEILVLTKNEYLEKQVQSIYPNWSNDLISTHTLNHSDKLTFIDAKINRKRF